MRIIGGTYGGRRLKAVDGYITRPTSDRVREALFSRVEARYGLAGSWILDVFSGTGALAIEALSRGAARAFCIELEKRALDTLKGNVREFDLGERVRVLGDDYRRVLARLAGPPTPRSFHGVFIDPPYGKGLAIAALEAVVALRLVRPGGWITVETGRREMTPEAVVGPQGVFERVREDLYGDTKLALYEAPPEAAANQTAGEHESPAAEADR